MNANPSKPWLDKATEDLAVARLVLTEKHTAHACSLSQQSIEKSLKAYLITKARTYPRIHNLAELLDLCEQIDPAFSQFMDDCIRVDEYYIPTRYPSGIPGMAAHGMPSESAANTAITTAKNILQFVTQQLG